MQRGHHRRATLLAFLLAPACGDDVPTQLDDGATSTGASDSSGSTGTPDVLDDTTAARTDTTSAADDDTTTGGEPPPPPLWWGDECVAFGSDLKELHPRVQCTLVEVPLDWDDPRGPTIDIAALRVTTEVSAADRRGQFWMLDGGPGCSGLGYLGDLTRIEAFNADGWDVVIPAHRGTLSPVVSCPGGDPYTSFCRQHIADEWGDALRHFNTAQAAHDLAELVARTQAELGERTIVYGASYGTTWAQYYMGLHPTQADGIVLDSVLGPTSDVATHVGLAEARAVDLLQRCVDDPICGPRVGFTSGQAFADAVAAAFDAEFCGAPDPGAWASSSFRVRLGFLLNLSKVRNFVPLLSALLQKCTPETTTLVNTAIDALLQYAFDSMKGERPNPMDRLTPEGWDIDPALYCSGEMFAIVTATTLLGEGSEPPAWSDASLVTLGIGGALQSVHTYWGDLPNVAFDPFFAAEVPVLILHGRYDLQTPLAWAEAAATQLDVPLHVVDDGSHALLFANKGGRSLDGTPCTVPLVLQFAAAPSNDLDTTCLDDLPTIDVNLERPDLQAAAMHAFGTADPWSLLAP